MKREEILKEHLLSYKTRLLDVMDQIKFDDLHAVVEVMINAFKENKTIYIVGNGGSAATASHMQADFRFFVRYFTDFRPKVTALTDNTPVITAIGNDTSFDNIFVEQMKGVFTAGDVLIAISASGNSPNVINAVKLAKELGGKTIGFVGFSGGVLKDVCEFPLFTPNKDKDYGPIEDLHMIIVHIIVNYLGKDPEFLSIPALK